VGLRLSFLRWMSRPALRAFEAAMADPQAAQRAALRSVLDHHHAAGYARHHGLRPDMSPEDLRAALPVVDYEDLRPWLTDLIETGHPGPRGTLVAERVSMFLKTSGNTGAPKLLPVTPSYEAEDALARRYWLERMLTEDESHALGRHWSVVSPAVEGLTPGGIPYGSNTGRIFLLQPSWLRAFGAVPYAVCAVKDFDLRYYLNLRHALSLPDLGTLTTANPSTVLLLCRRLLSCGDELVQDLDAGTLCHGDRALTWASAELGAALDPQQARRDIARWLRPDPKRARAVRLALQGGAPGLLRRLWPSLSTVNCWLGGHAPLYLAQLAPFLDADPRPIPLRDPGFSASEGFFAVPTRAGTPEGVLHLAGPFMEFVPEGGDEARPLLAHELQPGLRARLIVTTHGGLWRYDMKDLVEVTGFVGRAPLVRFVSKAGRTLSVTGEKVTEEQAIAVAAALVARFPVENACATLRLADPPRYLVAVEPLGEGASLDPQALAQAWDEAMSQQNTEYAEKRASGRLGKAEAVVVGVGAFARWRRRKVEGGAPDGQVKLPPLVHTEEELSRALLSC
jgi:hypothetical protein